LPGPPDGREAPYREYIEYYERNIEAFYSGR
jgi:hypothetical protein